MTDIPKETLQFFHGPNYSEGPWGSKISKCCILCKAKNNKGKTKFWAKDLCRSCYRRVSPAHRLYNDQWNLKNSKVLGTKVSSSEKKSYKELEDPLEVEFNVKDIKSLLTRYDFKCAYCRTKLQDHTHTAHNAFQLEYRVLDKSIELVPICRSCNCSKKNVTEPQKLARWAKERGIEWPPKYVCPNN